MTSHNQTPIQSTLANISRVFALLVTVSGITSIFIDFVAWSSFLSGLVEFYRKFSYPAYETVSSIFNIKIPNIARDIYSISYSIAACMLLSRGHSSGASALVSLIWSSAKTNPKNQTQEPFLKSLITALVGGILLAAFAPALLILTLFHKNSRIWGLDALRVYSLGFLIFVILAAYNSAVEKYAQSGKNFSVWLIPIIEQPIVQFVAIANVALIAIFFMAAWAASYLRTNKRECILNLRLATQYEMCAEGGLAVLICDQNISRKVKFASPRLTAEMDLFLSTSEYIRQGEAPKPTSRQTIFVVNRIVIIDIANGDGINFPSCIIPVIQRNRFFGTISKEKIAALPPTRCFSTNDDLLDAEPAVRELIEKARQATS